MFDGDPQFLDGNGRVHVGSPTTGAIGPVLGDGVSGEPVALVCINTRLDTLCREGGGGRVKKVILLGVEELCRGNGKQRARRSKDGLLQWEGAYHILHAADVYISRDQE